MLVNALVRVSTPLRSSCDPRPFMFPRPRKSSIDSACVIMGNDYYSDAVGMLIVSRDQILPLPSTWLLCQGAGTEAEQKPKDEYGFTRIFCVYYLLVVAVVGLLFPPRKVLQSRSKCLIGRDATGVKLACTQRILSHPPLTKWALCTTRCYYNDFPIFRLQSSSCSNPLSLVSRRTDRHC